MSASNIVASLLHTISCHASDVNDVCFSKKKMLATCSGDKIVRIWDTDTFTELPSSPLCGHSYNVHCCTFSPFGTLLASCSTDGKIIVWDMNTGKKKTVYQHESKSPVRVCRFSPDSLKLASGGDDNCLCLWDLASERLLSTFRGHDATVFACEFTPDSHFLVSGTSDGELMVWDAKFGHAMQLHEQFECHDLGILCCDFSHVYSSYIENNQQITKFLLATSGQDDLIKLWEFHSIPGSTQIRMKERAVLRGHTGSVMQCCFSLNGKMLASASIDKTVRLWDPVKESLLHVLESHTRYVTCCAFSSNGQYLATGSNDKTVLIWQLQSEQQLMFALANKNDGCIASSNQEQSRDYVINRVKPESWTVENVCCWLSEIGLSQYEDNFRKHDIDGQELLTLNHVTLEKCLGIESLGHRNKIQKLCTQLLEHPLIQMKSFNASKDAVIPDEYLCPITMEIMKDPVICADGYTYERTAITSWIQQGKNRSPMTNAVLGNHELTPNRTFKILIQKYLNS